MAVASLIEAISVSGFGVAAASGTAAFYSPGTTTPLAVYQDATAGIVYPQPITLDANGRTPLPVFATAPVRMKVFSAGGAVLVDVDQENVITDAQLALNTGITGLSPATLGGLLSSMITSFGTTAVPSVKVPGTGAVNRLLNAKLAERYLSVVDFGAIGNGVADDTAAIQRTFDAVAALGGGEVSFPKGSYLTSSQVACNSAGALRVTGIGRGSTVTCSASNISIFKFTAPSVFVQSVAVTASGTLDDAFEIISSSALLIDCYGIGFPTFAFIYFNQSSASTICTLINCNAFQSNGTTAGVLYAQTGTSPSSIFLSCTGILPQGSNVRSVAIGHAGDMGNTAVVVGGTGTVAGTSTSSFIMANPFTVAMSSAAARLQTFAANGSGTIDSAQGLAVLKATVAAITVTTDISSYYTGYWLGQKTVRFWNASAGAVTWAFGAGVTIRGAAVAPAAGNSVYVTFSFDHQSGTLVEVARS